MIYRGSPFNLDLDVKIRVENKISLSLLRMFVAFDLMDKGPLRKPTLEKLDK